MNLRFWISRQRILTLALWRQIIQARNSNFYFVFRQFIFTWKCKDFGWNLTCDLLLFKFENLHVKLKELSHKIEILLNSFYFFFKILNCDQIFFRCFWRDWGELIFLFLSKVSFLWKGGSLRFSLEDDRGSQTEVLCSHGDLVLSLGPSFSDRRASPFCFFSTFEHFFFLLEILLFENDNPISRHFIGGSIFESENAEKLKRGPL